MPFLLLGLVFAVTSKQGAFSTSNDDLQGTEITSNGEFHEAEAIKSRSFGREYLGMADGLSVAASVIAVTTLAGTCLKLSKKWLGPSEFDSADLASIKTTLLVFAEAMTKLQIHLTALGHDEARQESLEYLPQVLERCIQALGVVHGFIQNSGFIGKYVVAPRFDRKLKRSLEALEAAKEVFALALNANNQ